MIFCPNSCLPVVWTFNIKIPVTNHVPEHDAKLIESQAGHPMGTVPPEANDATGGNVGVEDGCLPGKFRDHPWIGRSQGNIHLMSLADKDLPIRTFGKPFSMETEGVAFGIQSALLGLEIKDRTFQATLLLITEYGRYIPCLCNTDPVHIVY